jgi:hypothetical protein
MIQIKATPRSFCHHHSYSSLPHFYSQWRFGGLDGDREGEKSTLQMSWKGRKRKKQKQKQQRQRTGGQQKLRINF